jgi:hypothetical protein
MVGRSGAGVCGVRPGKRLSVLCGVHATVFQVEAVILTCEGMCGECIHWCIEVWKCRQELCPVKLEQGYAPVDPWSQWDSGQ